MNIDDDGEHPDRPSLRRSIFFEISWWKFRILTSCYPNARPLVVDGRCTGSYTCDPWVCTVPYVVMDGKENFVL